VASVADPPSPGKAHGPARPPTQPGGRQPPHDRPAAGTLPASASTQPAAAHPDTTTGPTVYEQAAYNQNIPIATGNTHTIVSSSPVLAEGTYQVNSVILVANLTAGSNVLCGWTTSASGDDLYGNYGDVENQDATATNGNCAVTGIAKINNPGDHLQLWVTVYSGPAGPNAGSWSINETPVAKAVVSSLT
jgi:hypothetical protein